MTKLRCIGVEALRMAIMQGLRGSMVTANLRVVDFQRVDEMVLTRILDDHNATVSDWMEKDYGVLLYVDVPNENLESIKKAIGNNNNFGYSDIEWELSID